MDVKDELILNYAMKIVYRELKKRVKMGENRAILDFSFPLQRLDIPLAEPVTWYHDIEPEVINFGKLMMRDLPGIWGYTEAAGFNEKWITCCCGKEVSKR